MFFSQCKYQAAKQGVENILIEMSLKYIYIYIIQAGLDLSKKKTHVANGIQLTFHQVRMWHKIIGGGGQIKTHTWLLQKMLDPFSITYIGVPSHEISPEK